MYQFPELVYMFEHEGIFPEYIVGHYLEPIPYVDNHEYVWNKFRDKFILKYYDEIDQFWF